MVVLLRRSCHAPSENEQVDCGFVNQGKVSQCLRSVYDDTAELTGFKVFRCNIPTLYLQYNNRSYFLVSFFFEWATLAMPQFIRYDILWFGKGSTTCHDWDIVWAGKRTEGGTGRLARNGLIQETAQFPAGLVSFWHSIVLGNC